ncbi:MAG: cobalamin biosynthesis protein, partial [Acidobacteria bacterium]|nr:cobalamin biosynthesis protein [Acidobacteriota bacterium]
MEDQVDVSMNVLPPNALLPTATLLVAAVLADALLGDPVYWWHPVRLLGRSLQILERALRRLGLDGYLGGCLLFLILSVIWVGGVSLLLWWLANLSRAAAAAFHLFLLYNMIALRDLLRHGMRVDRDARSGDLDAARRNLSMLVSRDTDRMDAAACRRAAVES